VFVCFWRDIPQGARASSFTMFLDHTQSVGLLWTGDQLYLTTHNTHNKHPCPLWDSNSQSQQTSGRRPTPYSESCVRLYLLSIIIYYYVVWLLRFEFPFEESVVIKTTASSAKHYVTINDEDAFC
jgi:hypothetical protein